jgi:NADH-quinone oxidoreductase subunit J
MGTAIAFYVISACILGFAVLVISTKFLAAIQILVYAGGIVVLYLFVVMLVNLKRPPEAHADPHRKTKLGFGLAAAVLAELALLAVRSSDMPVRPIVQQAAAPVTGNTEVVGWMLYTSYLIPFEIASMLLLVAMIGAIVLAKREL